MKKFIIAALMLMVATLARGDIYGWTPANVAGVFGRPANIERSVVGVDSCYPLNCDVIVERWIYRYDYWPYAVQLIVVFQNGRVTSVEQ